MMLFCAGRRAERANAGLIPENSLVPLDDRVVEALPDYHA
jgi:hypothetical protein